MMMMIFCFHSFIFLSPNFLFFLFWQLQCMFCFVCLDSRYLIITIMIFFSLLLFQCLFVFRILQNLTFVVWCEHIFFFLKVCVTNLVDVVDHHDPSSNFLLLTPAFFFVFLFLCVFFSLANLFRLVFGSNRWWSFECQTCYCVCFVFLVVFFRVTFFFVWRVFEKKPNFHWYDCPPPPAPPLQNHPTSRQIFVLLLLSIVVIICFFFIPGCFFGNFQISNILVNDSRGKEQGKKSEDN